MNENSNEVKKKIRVRLSTKSPTVVEGESAHSQEETEEPTLGDYEQQRVSESNKETQYVTGSRYKGTYDLVRQCMEGFGTYTYPDGNEYRGYFRHGVFHGYGTFRLADAKCTYKGIFENGKLVSIEEIVFGDGLLCKANVDQGGEVRFDDWEYLREDRRYASEKQKESPAVGPDAYLTCIRPSRVIPKMAYDTEEGFYKSNGYIWDIPTPYNHYRTVGCQKEVEWIQKYCRKSDDLNYNADGEPEEPLPEFCKTIIDTNNAAAYSSWNDECHCKDEQLRRKAFVKLCKAQRILEESEQDLAKSTHECQAHSPQQGGIDLAASASSSSSANNIMPLTNTSSSTNKSFCEEPLPENIQEDCLKLQHKDFMQRRRLNESTYSRMLLLKPKHSDTWRNDEQLN